jgi:hypothetical protein
LTHGRRARPARPRPRRHLVGITDGRTLTAGGPTRIARAALLLPLLAPDRPGRLWTAVLVAVGQSFLARLAGPAGFALLPTLVAAADLPRTNALLGLANALVRLGGARRSATLVECEQAVNLHSTKLCRTRSGRVRGTGRDWSDGGRRDAGCAGRARTFSGAGR